LIDRRNINSRLQNWARLYQRVRDVQQHDRRAFDQVDAQHIDAAMPGLPTLQRSLLWWCYVKLDTADGACLMLGLANKPAVQFIEAFQHAQAAIEALAAGQSR